MADPIRVELKAPLEGHHILVDPDGLTFGLIEDMQSGQARGMLDGLAACIVGGDLPKGTGRAGLRALKPAEITAVIGAVDAAWSIPKS